VLPQRTNTHEGSFEASPDDASIHTLKRSSKQKKDKETKKRKRKDPETSRASYDMPPERACTATPTCDVRHQATNSFPAVHRPL